MKTKKQIGKRKATVSFTDRLLTRLDKITDAHFRPRLGMDRSDVICYFCELGMKSALPITLADLGTDQEKEAV